MRATPFEFRHRVWIIALLYTAAFCCRLVDPRNTAVALTALLAGGSRASTALRFQQGVFAAGALVIAAGAMLRTWGTAYLRVGVMVDPEIHFDRLVADGPYRHVRNPLYLGNILVAVGLAVMLSPTGAIVLVLGMAWFVLRLLLSEEAALLEAQGESYRQYCAAVPRLWPALVPRVPEAGTAPFWSDAIVAELLSWGIAASVAVFAATYDVPAFFGILIGFIVLRRMGRTALRRRPPRPS